MSLTDVVWADSNMAGAPVMSGAAGSLIGVLDAVLVNGFNTITLDSLAVVGGVAIATKSVGHGFGDNVVTLVAGATPAGLNGRKRINRLTATTFSFSAVGISDQTATGTVSAKVAPAQWEKIFSGTSKGAYRGQNIAGTRFYLRVDDTATGSAQVRGYETMSDIDTGADPFPTVAQGSGYWRRSGTADATARPWWAVADDRAVWVFIASSAGYPNAYAPFFFGDFPSAWPGDAYACALAASSTSAAAGSVHEEYNAPQAGHYLARSASGATKSVQFGKTRGSYDGAIVQPSWMGHAGFTASAEAACTATPLLLYESDGGQTIIRGVFPGVYAPLAHPTTGTHGEFKSDGGRLLLYGRGTHNGASPSFAGLAVVDLSGWWT